MQHSAKSIRAFIGAKNFEASRQFYRDLGFTESVVSSDTSQLTVWDFTFRTPNRHRGFACALPLKSDCSLEKKFQSIAFQV